MNRCYNNSFLFSLIKFIRTTIALNLLNHKKVVDIFIAPSMFLKSKIELDGVPTDKILLIRNPLNHQICQLSHFNKEPLIVFVGRLSQEKGLDILINAFLYLKRKQMIKGYNLYIIGDGPEREKLELMSEGDENILFLGYQKHEAALNYLAKAELLVLPSICYENFPMVMVEALLNGCKILVTDHGGMKEFASLFPQRVFLFSFDRDKTRMSINLAGAMLQALSEKINEDICDYENIYEWSDNRFLERITEVYYDC